ncbi:hypothetical protein EPUS_04718 [Endocarpon pusillum Z07020]|uniref:Uncharacterized protein n=1 Tax=Endocarpon pusillum (strain Z07020 / HMAS-L-300199) TaxID=1263415 RepID=U1HJL9_ENDPU|nr:uncharacterized protein EPUS_04718 [Endocarpon pusillum Z07020]ERF70440.1 hypothetical protein EPUS_04718 [Endocarpon pusillum Z07020]
MGIGILLLSAIPGLKLRIHHYILALLLLPGTSLQTRPSLLYQGLLVGLFINGIARWDFASILQTPAALLEDGLVGSLLPEVVTPAIVANNITFAWDTIAEGFQGISVMFSVGNTECYINGSDTHFWPPSIGLESYLPEYANAYIETIECSSATGYIRAVYPNGGYLALMDRFSAGTAKNRAGISTSRFENTRIFAQSARDAVLIQRSQAQVAPQVLSGQLYG